LNLADKARLRYVCDVRLADLIEEIPDEATARHFMMVGAITSGIVAVVSAVPAVLSRDLFIPDSLFFAVVAWRVLRGSRFWSVAGLIAFIVEKMFHLILVPPTPSSAAVWVWATLITCGFIAGVRGTYALFDLGLDDNPYARL
jgi:cell shape-determining protein MreD